MRGKRTCQVCNRSFAVADMGPREPMYCSSRCRQKAYRQRKQAVMSVDDTRNAGEGTKANDA